MRIRKSLAIVFVAFLVSFYSVLGVSLTIVPEPPIQIPPQYPYPQPPYPQPPYPQPPYPQPIPHCGQANYETHVELTTPQLYLRKPAVQQLWIDVILSQEKHCIGQFIAHSTPQHFNVVVKNDRGEVLFDWGRSALFPQVLTYINTASYSNSVRIDLPGHINFHSAEGRGYTLSIYMLKVGEASHTYRFDENPGKRTRGLIETEILLKKNPYVRPTPYGDVIIVE